MRCMMSAVAGKVAWPGPVRRGDGAGVAAAIAIDQAAGREQRRAPMANLLWLQGGACSGNTMSFLNAEEPSVCDLVTDFGINVLWHPSLGLELGQNLQNLLRGCLSGAVPLDIFVFEGTV